jgi:hypothetical protein
MDAAVVQCNYKADTSVCAKGARAYLVSFDVVGKRVRVVARSRSGRWVDRWEHQRNLHNFRLKTLAADDPLASRTDLPIAKNEWSQEVVDNLNKASGEAGD